MKEISKLLDNNKIWAQNVEKNIPGFFRKLENQHRPKFLWIGCSDSRVPADQLIGVMPGEVFVHRNISNQVINTDINLMCVLQYAHRRTQGEAHHRLRPLRLRRHRGGHERPDPGPFGSLAGERAMT